MKRFIKFILSSIIFLLLFFSSAKAETNGPIFSDDESKWLRQNNGKAFTVGIDPYSGIEYFTYDEDKKGYMEPLLKIISDDLGIDLKLKIYDSWSEVYSELQRGNIEILCGANETPERNKIMSFTKPILATPYAIIAQKDGSVHTIGDIDGKSVGFLKDDFVVDSIPQLYKRINYKTYLYNSQEKGIDALMEKRIDAFITSGGPVIYDYIYKHPELSYAFKLNTINSDMTFSSKKENKIIIDILDKELSYLKDNNLDNLINKAEVDYNIKVMGLSQKEKKWLKEDGTAIVGITKNYLPFDYYENGKYTGIDAQILKEITRKTGIKLEYVYDDFDVLAEKLKNGNINILNIAKTEDRLSQFLYSQPFGTERDIIVGRNDSKDVRDIFGLEGKKVAVIKGFWHQELLKKNLTNVKIIETQNIEESMKLVHEGKADYLIENPTVVRYYITDLQYYDLVQRGNTSADSFLYFGVSKNKPELSAIISKVLPMIDIDELSTKGYEEVPHKTNNGKYKSLIFTITGLIILLTFVLLFIIKLFNDLLNEKTEKKLLEQREYLLSIDTLTELHNRNYLISKVLINLDISPYPQVLIVCDLNNLKLINDNYGHQQGDMLLKLFADTLKEVFINKYSLFRIGGDEFLVVLTGTNEEEAKQFIKDIKKKCEEKSIKIGDNGLFNLSASLGYSVRQSSNITYEEMFRQADKAMYEDKRIIKENI